MRTHRWKDAPEDVRKLTTKRPDWVAVDCDDPTALPWDRVEFVADGVAIGYDFKAREKRKPVPTKQKEL